MKAAIYARVSTANNGQDLTVQTREIEECCARRGWKVAGQYIDVGISGAKEKRPQLDRLMPPQKRPWRFELVAGGALAYDFAQRQS